jgi:hypothetical protein
VPETVIASPGAPLAGENPVIVGGGITTKSFVEVAAPRVFVTRIGPVVAPAGTNAAICVSLTTWNVAGAPLKVTPTVPVKLDPLMLT